MIEVSIRIKTFINVCHSKLILIIKLIINLKFIICSKLVKIWHGSVIQIQKVSKFSDDPNFQIKI